MNWTQKTDAKKLYAVYTAISEITVEHCSLTVLDLHLLSTAQVMHMYTGHGRGCSFAVLLASGEGWRADSDQARATVLRPVSPHQGTAVKVCRLSLDVVNDVHKLIK